MPLNWLEVSRVPEFREFFLLSSLEAETLKTNQVDILERTDNILKSIYKPNRVAEILTATCYHAELPPKYICIECGKAFCKDCVKIVATGVNAVCQFCGSLCHSYEQAIEKAKILIDQKAKFGKEDFKAALDYPLRYYVQMLFISALYSFSLIIGFFGFPLASVIANTIIYSVTSVVIKTVMVRDLEKESLFDVSALLSQPINPLLMGLGLQLVTTGPYELVHFLTVMSGEVNITDIVFSKYSAFFYPIFSVFTIPTILWVAFYYPIALLVAGVTDDFKSVINPLVGLNTIKKLGKPFKNFFFSYLKVCFIVFPIVILIAMVVKPYITLIMTMAMFIPFLNVIAIIVLGTFLMFPIVYANLMIAYLLGRVVFKFPKEIGVMV